MKKSDILKSAYENLLARKSRTKMTIVGITIGMCSVIIMLSIGIGINKMMTHELLENSSLKYMSVMQLDQGAPDSGNSMLGDSELEYIKSLPHVKAASPRMASEGNIDIKCGRFSCNSVVGIDLLALKELGYELSEGSFDDVGKYSVFFGKQAKAQFSDQNGNMVNYSLDKNGNISSCDIDPMKELFGAAPAIFNETVGKVNTKSVPLKTGGVFKSSKTDESVDYNIYISLELFSELNNKAMEANNNQGDFKSGYGSISVILDNQKNLKETKQILQDNGFTVYSKDEELKEIKKLMFAVQAVLGAIGGIALIVAAVGISNTMVMAVYERTKEIGVMKVLGCEIDDIKRMFIYEAGILGAVGGVLALIISYIISILANLIAKFVYAEFLNGGDTYVLVSSIPIYLAIGALLFSIAVGVIAGLKPAKKAINVSALTAIHNE